jgi:Sulfotransferase family
MNPYVFFVGCPRSGTTLLRRMADAHRELAVIRELHWLPRWWEQRVGIEPDGTVTHELAQRLVSDPRFTRLEIGAERAVELVRNGRPKHYARFVTELFDSHGRAKEKRLVGEKTPKYVRYLSTLHELWPHAKIVHLIRDGRDVALSLLEWSKAKRNVGRFSTWEEDRVMTAALFWEWNVRLGREAGRLLGPEAYYELRYEALVTDAQLECRKLCDFLALTYDPSMLRFHEGRTKSRTGLSAKKAWKPVTAGLRDWREQMAPGDVARFESGAGGLLDELGYERTATRSSCEDIAFADQIRHAFAADAHARQLPVPQAWRGVAP